LPLIFICEDNGIGISTKTPGGWVEASLKHRPGLKYVVCNGLDAVETYHKTRELAHWVRTQRKPAVLHMGCIRLYGHAGADVQSVYMAMSEIEAQEANDPLLHTARRLIDEAGLSRQTILDIYQDCEARVARVSEAATARPKLVTADERS